MKTFFNRINNNVEVKKPIEVKKFKNSFLVVIAFILALTAFNLFTFTVKEDQVAVVSEWGKVTKVIVDRGSTDVDAQNLLRQDFKNVSIVKEKGIFFKWPFVASVYKDTSKLLTYSSNSETINTRDKRQYQITMFAQWEISHPGLFYLSMGSISKANSFLDDLIYPIVIKRINSLDSEVFLTDKDELNKTLGEGLAQLNDRVGENGIKVKDIEVYRTILPASNIESTYRKMIAEREAIAQQITSEGNEQYEMTVAETNKDVAKILAQAIEESEKIRGNADAQATKIYAETFSVDPDFYEFWRTMNAYDTAIDGDTEIHMDKNNKFLKYFSIE